MRHGSLFSGIGGFDLAAEWMGWENVFHCEWNPFAQKILKYYWPNAISYEDICATDFTIHRGSIDLLTGGFPCQPYSTAGKRLGKADERHLFPEMLRAIKEIQPRWVIGENVRGLVSWNGGMVFDEVCADLESEGYEVIPFLIPAASVNAPHRRDRIWFVAKNSNQNGWGSNKWEKKSQEWRQRNISAGINEQFYTNNEKIITNESSERLEGTTGKSIQKSSNGSSGIITNNSDSITKRTSRESRSIESEGSKINIQQDEWREKTEQHNRSSRFTQYAADTNGIGRDNGSHNRKERQFPCNEEWNTEESKSERSRRVGRIRQISGNGHAADTSGIGLRRQGDGIGNTKQFSKNCTAKDWQNFPTVSPLCNGDDGLSDRLDSITFPKWRKESIKGGGNAIVPQVVYEIFKAIQIYETETI